MAVNYEDQRFKNVEAEKQQELNKVNNTYNQMINSSQKYYNDLAKASDDYAKTQKDIQQANTDFAIEKINQNKEWAEKDYTKEQKGAYADWRKQSNEYGPEAELMASRGLTNTGYSESSQVSMYNTYQNRVATARESYIRAVQDYDNSIKEAQLANNSALADIAYKALQTKLQLSLEGFQYKNSLLQSRLSAQQATSDRYYSRWRDVLNQINTENALAEEQRQFNAQMGASSSSGSYGGGGGAYISEGQIDNSGNITTAYYSGKINKDAKNGTFSNGYQPNNINGKKLSGTGKYIDKKGVTLQGTKTTTRQQLWTYDGGKTLYYWDGNKNKYVQYKG